MKSIVQIKYSVTKITNYCKTVKKFFISICCSPVRLISYLSPKTICTSTNPLSVSNNHLCKFRSYQQIAFPKSSRSWWHRSMRCYFFDLTHKKKQFWSDACIHSTGNSHHVLLVSRQGFNHGESLIIISRWGKK